MVLRSNYTDLIRLYMDKPFIKVITGVHRCGKSHVLQWVSRELRVRGVDYQNILYRDFEVHGKESLADGKELAAVLKQQMAERPGRRYLLLDEIQYLPGWERCVKELYEREDCDIYLAGSKAALLEGKDAGLILRNCVQIRMYPYSFSEFLEQEREEEPGLSRDACFERFFRLGSMPGIRLFHHEEEAVHQYLLDVCKAAMLQDAVRENNLRGIGQLWMMLGYLAETLGQPVSAKTISDGMNRTGRQISKDTVYGMLKALESGHIIYRAKRYDLKEGRAVEAREKYYFSDWGIYHALHGIEEHGTQGVLENMVCMELLARGFRVYRGKIGRREFDFWAERGKEQYCIQVRKNLEDVEEAKEAASVLASVKRQCRKLFLLKEGEAPAGQKGRQKEIVYRNILDFLENA